MSVQPLEGEIITGKLDDWRLYDGVRSKRVFAFLIDYLIVGILCIFVAILIAVLGVITLGLGWFLYGIMVPLVALTYVYVTMGGPDQATKGMKIMGIKLARLDGKPVDGLLAVVHSVLFWASCSILTPLILLATFFIDRKRLLHDLFLGTVIVRSN